MVNRRHLNLIYRPGGINETIRVNLDDRMSDYSILYLSKLEPLCYNQRNWAAFDETVKLRGEYFHQLISAIRFGVGF